MALFPLDMAGLTLYEGTHVDDAWSTILDAAFVPIHMVAAIGSLGKTSDLMSTSLNDVKL